MRKKSNNKVVIVTQTCYTYGIPPTTEKDKV